MPRDTSKAQLWAARLDRFRRSGLSISQFCRNEKINLQVFSYWRKKLEPNIASSTPNTPSIHCLMSTLASFASSLKLEDQDPVPGQLPRSDQHRAGLGHATSRVRLQTTHRLRVRLRCLLLLPPREFISICRLSI